MISVHGSEIAEGHAFQAQAWSNVLVASSSGFSRMAAVLSRNTIIAPHLLSHPLEGLEGVINIYSREFWDRESGDFKIDGKLKAAFEKSKSQVRSALHNQFQRDKSSVRMACLRP